MALLSVALGGLYVSMLVTWCQVIMIGCWLAVGVPTVIDMAGCEQHGTNMSCLWQPGRLRYRGVWTQWVFKCEGILDGARLIAVSLAVQQA